MPMGIPPEDNNSIRCSSVWHTRGNEDLGLDACNGLHRDCLAIEQHECMTPHRNMTR